MKPVSDLDVLLFDLGGVLVDFAGFDELARLVPGNLDRTAIRRRWITSPTVQRFERGEIPADAFARGVLLELELELSSDAFVEAFASWARGLVPGADALLRRLRPGRRLACLSNSNRLHTPLHRQSVEPFLDRLYFSDEIGMVKPEPRIFRHVIADLAVAPSSIVFFDDTEVNVVAARAAGMTAFEVDGLAALEERLLKLGALSPRPAP